MKEAAFTKTSNKIPIDFFKVRLAVSIIVHVDLGNPNPNYLYTTSSIKLILTPKSHNDPKSLNALLA